MKTIAILNRKGGVGKTSMTHHLSGAFSKLGKSVLLIDGDPQASLTQGFFGPPATRALDASETIAAIFAGDRPYPDQLIRPAGSPGVDLVAGSRFCDDYNFLAPWKRDPEDQECLKNFLGEVESDRYDFALIDCPPNLYLCSWAALVAADYLIVPLQPEDYGSQGIMEVQEALGLVHSGPNPELRLLGFLLTMVEMRKSVHQNFSEGIRMLYPGDVFQTTVARAAQYVEAITKRQTITQYKPKSGPALAMMALAGEIMTRISWIESHTLAEAS